MLTELARSTDVDVLMLAGRYTLLEQAALDDLLPVCERRGIGRDARMRAAKIPCDLWGELREERLLHAEAPVPSP
jgi:hypothetical protein